MGGIFVKLISMSFPTFGVQNPKVYGKPDVEEVRQPVVACCKRRVGLHHLTPQLFGWGELGPAILSCLHGKKMSKMSTTKKHDQHDVLFLSKTVLFETVWKLGPGTFQNCSFFTWDLKLVAVPKFRAMSARESSQKLLLAEEGQVQSGWPVVQPLEDHSHSGGDQQIVENETLESSPTKNENFKHETKMMNLMFGNQKFPTNNTSSFSTRNQICRRLDFGRFEAPSFAVHGSFAFQFRPSRSWASNPDDPVLDTKKTLQKKVPSICHINLWLQLLMFFRLDMIWHKIKSKKNRQKVRRKDQNCRAYYLFNFSLVIFCVLVMFCGVCCGLPLCCTRIWLWFWSFRPFRRWFRMAWPSLILWSKK